MNTILGETGLTMSQCHVLAVLRDTGEMTMSTLARALGITLSAATNQVDRLVDAGLVARARSEADRRVVLTRLTPKGAEMLERDMSNLEAFWADVLEQVSPDKRGTFFTVYEQILHLAEETTGT